MMKSFHTTNPDHDRLHADELADCVQALEDASQTLIQLYGNYSAALCLLRDAKVDHRLHDSIEERTLDAVCDLQEIKTLLEGDLEEANYTLEQKGIKQIALPTI